MKKSTDGLFQPPNKTRFSIWVHLVIWCVGALVYRVLFHPVAAVLALDFEALVSNLALDWWPATINTYSRPHAWFADSTLIPWGRFFLRFGAAPLTVLFVAASAFRGLEFFRPGSNPLALLPTKGKLTLALVALVPFLLFCLPFSLAFAVWTGVEGFWWIQWYQNVTPFMGWVLTRLPWVAGPAAFIIGVFALVFSLSGRRKGRGPGAIPWLRRSALVIVFIALAVLCPVLALHGARVAGAPGREVFEARCGGCHERTLALYYIKAPAAWARTIDTQVEVEGVDLSATQSEDLFQFLTAMRSFSNKRTFQTRCRRCHLTSYWDWEDRKPEDWAAIVDRIARWSPYYYRPDIREQIVEYLGRTRSENPDAFGLNDETHQSFKEVEKTCGACHSLSYEAQRVRRESPRAFSEMMARMNRKLPEALSESALEKLASDYRDLISDPERFDRIFPHDRPVLSGGLPW